IPPGGAAGDGSIPASYARFRRVPPRFLREPGTRPNSPRGTGGRCPAEDETSLRRGLGARRRERLAHRDEPLAAVEELVRLRELALGEVHDGDLSTGRETHGAELVSERRYVEGL